MSRLTEWDGIVSDQLFIHRIARDYSVNPIDVGIDFDRDGFWWAVLLYEVEKDAVKSKK